MMDGYGNGMGGWGYGLATVALLLFLGLVIAGIVVLLRQQGGSTPRTSPGENTPERILAERFSRGEIDEEEYRRRIDILRGQVKP